METWTLIQRSKEFRVPYKPLTKQVKKRILSKCFLRSFGIHVPYMLVFWFSGILKSFFLNSFIKYQFVAEVYISIYPMKNAFQELIKSTNKEDQASCEIQDLEESSNTMGGLKK